MSRDPARPRRGRIGRRRVTWRNERWYLPIEDDETRDLDPNDTPYPGVVTRWVADMDGAAILASPLNAWSQWVGYWPTARQRAWLSRIGAAPQRVLLVRVARDSRGRFRAWRDR